MSHISDNIIQGAVEQIIVTRDFCGSRAAQREAVIDFCSDNGVDKADWDKVFGIANFRANRKWDQFRREAGVDEKYIAFSVAK